MKRFSKSLELNSPSLKFLRPLGNIYALQVFARSIARFMPTRYSIRWELIIWRRASGHRWLTGKEASFKRSTSIQGDLEKSLCRGSDLGDKGLYACFLSPSISISR